MYKSLKKTQLNSTSYATKKSNFNQYINRLGKTIALAKRMYYKTIFEQYKQDMKKTWAILSDILHREAVNSLPDTMTVEGHDCGDRKAIAEEFNNFFATVGERNGHTNSEGDCNFRDYLTHKTEKFFHFVKLTILLPFELSRI